MPHDIWGMVSRSRDVVSLHIYMQVKTCKRERIQNPLIEATILVCKVQSSSSGMVLKCTKLLRSLMHLVKLATGRGALVQQIAEILQYSMQAT